MNRISMNGNSALLSDLAREAGSSVRSTPVSSSLNVIPVTVINAPAEGQARNSSGVKLAQSSSGVKQTQEREEVKVEEARRILSDACCCSAFTPFINKEERDLNEEKKSV